MKRTKHLGVAVVVALSGSLLMGCSSDSATTNTASTPATSPTMASSPAATTPAATPLPGTDPIYRLEEDPNGLSYSDYETALPDDLAVERVTYGVKAIDPSGPSDNDWRGLIQRVALVPETGAALEGGHRDLDSFLLTALGSGEENALKPDTLVDVEGVRVAQRDIGWGLSHYVWYKDGALFTYHGKPDWGDPFLATWFAHPELVLTSPTSG